MHHPVSTKNSRAQKFFDQGLALAFGFNHDEARRSFERAAGLDPKLAMAWWGVALTLGPNYNLPVDPEREKAGYEAVQRAVALQENFRGFQEHVRHPRPSSCCLRSSAGTRF